MPREKLSPIEKVAAIEEANIRSAQIILEKPPGGLVEEWARLVLAKAPQK